MQKLRLTTVVVLMAAAMSLGVGPGSEQDYLQMGNFGICEYDSVVLANGVADTLISFSVGGLVEDDTYLTLVDSTYNDHLQGGNIVRLFVDLGIISGDSAEIDSMWMTFVHDIKPTWGPFKNVDGSMTLVDSLSTTADTYGVSGIYRFNAQRGAGGRIYRLPIWSGRGIYYVMAKQNPAFTDTNYVRTIVFKGKI